MLSYLGSGYKTAGSNPAIPILYIGEGKPWWFEVDGTSAEVPAALAKPERRLGFTLHPPKADELFVFSLFVFCKFSSNMPVILPFLF